MGDGVSGASGKARECGVTMVKVVWVQQRLISCGSAYLVVSSLCGQLLAVALSAKARSPWGLVSFVPSDDFCNLSLKVDGKVEVPICLKISNCSYKETRLGDQKYM
jgi:hypothetical protein